MRHTAIRLPESLYDRLGRIAAGEGISMSEWIRSALRHAADQAEHGRTQAGNYHLHPALHREFYPPVPPPPPMPQPPPPPPVRQPSDDSTVPLHKAEHPVRIVCVTTDSCLEETHDE